MCLRPNAGAWATLSILLLFTRACHSWTVPRGGVLSVNSSSSTQQQRPRTRRTRTDAPGWCLRLSSSSSSSITNKVDRDAQVQNVLQLARRLGPVGSRQSPADQQLLLDAALELRSLSDPTPSRIPLTGVHHLV